MPDDDSSSASSPPPPSAAATITPTSLPVKQGIDMPPPASKKRKRSIASTSVPIKISAAPQPVQPTNVALPPPLIPYHPHLVPSYYPVYHQHPYYLSVGPQPPVSPSLSPTSSSSPSLSATTQRILPKSPHSTPTTSAVPPPPPIGYYPYPIQVSPQLHPTASHPPPGNISPTPYHPMNSSPMGLSPMTNNSVVSVGSATTADQREQARKVSHSAIERRRRERINDKILQLKDLIPSCANRDNLHKMTILQSAIDYITYLKKMIDGLDTEDRSGDAVSQQTKSLFPKEVEPFTYQFAVNLSEKQQPSSSSQNEENTSTTEGWSSSKSPATSPLPTAGLKPMDLIKVGKEPNKQDSESPPHIGDRNMNLENLLC